MASLKRPKIGIQDQLLLNVGQKYCRMLQGEHSSILSTFIKLPFVIKTFVLSIFEWPFYTGFTQVLLFFYLRHFCRFKDVWPIYELMAIFSYVYTACEYVNAQPSIEARCIHFLTNFVCGRSDGFGETT